MTTERNPAFDIYRTQCVFSLRLAHLMQENRQRLHQFQVQTAQHAIDATSKMTEAVMNAQDWSSLANLSTGLIQQQSELAANVWQEFFALATDNRTALLHGVREAVEDLQAKNTAALQGGTAMAQPNTIFQDMFKQFGPFMDVAATAYSKPANRPAKTKHGANHAE